MNSKFKIFIHLGYPKTGTTYLQNYIFNNLTNVNYIGINNKFDKIYFYENPSLKMMIKIPKKNQYSKTI